MRDLVIVCDFDFVGISCLPAKTDAVLVVDPNTMLAEPVTPQPLPCDRPSITQAETDAVSAAGRGVDRPLRRGVRPPRSRSGGLEFLTDALRQKNLQKRLIGYVSLVGEEFQLRQQKVWQAQGDGRQRGLQFR